MQCCVIDVRHIVLLLRILVEVVPSQDGKVVLDDSNGVTLAKYGLQFHSDFLPELEASLTKQSGPALNESIVSRVPYNVTVVCLQCGDAFTAIVNSFVINVTRANGSELQNYVKVGKNGATIILPDYVTWRAPQLALLACVNFRLEVTEGNITFLSNTILCRYTGCMSYHNMAYGLLGSPDHDNITEVIQCTYVVVSEIMQHVQIQFQELNMPTIESSCVNYVRVLGSASDNKHRCGNALRATLDELHFSSLDYRLVIIYVGNYSAGVRRFQAQYHHINPKGCSKNLTRSYGTINSPNYPQPFFPSTQCVYIILHPLGSRVRISVKFMEMERDDLGDCTWDYIEARDGRAELRRWCGAHEEYPRHKLIVTSQVASDNQSYVEIIFHSDAIGEGRGFVVSYVVIDPMCPSPLEITAYGGDIYSPGYPEDYPPSIMCLNGLHSTRESIIEMQFSVLSTLGIGASSLPRSGSACSNDYVDIYDGINNHRRCGDWENLTDKLFFRSHGSDMSVRFVSNADNMTSVGFHATWETVNNSFPMKLCQGDWIDGGTYCIKIVSQYPQDWATANTMCSKNGGYLATVNNNQSDYLIQRYMKQKNLDQNQGFWIGANDVRVENDFYWLDNSHAHYTNWFPGWTQFNGSRAQPSDDGLSDEDCVEMRKTFSLPHKGIGVADKYYWNDRQCTVKNGYICQVDTMKAKVALESKMCDQDMVLSRYGDEQSFSSPNYPNKYGNLQDCHVDVSSPKGTRILVEFLHFHLETDNNCTYDYVSMSPMLHSARPLVHCGHGDRQHKKLRHVSRGRYLHVHFHSDESFVFSGFFAKVSVFNETEMTIINDEDTALSGEDMNPGFLAGNYSHNLIRNLTLSLPIGYRIFINLTFIDIEYHHLCSYDSLTIGDSDPALNHYSVSCGLLRKQKTSYFVSETNIVIISFASDYDVTSRGYSLTWAGYDMSLCNSTVHIHDSASLSLSSFNHPIAYFSLLQCHTTIVADTGYRVLLEFTKYQLAVVEGSRCADYVTVNISNSSQPVMMCPETGYTPFGSTFLSEFNTLEVMFHTDREAESGGYNAVYRQVNTMVEDLTKVIIAKQFSHDTIHSLNFNLGLLSNVSQTVTIIAPLGNNVIVKIQRFILNERCEKVSIELRDLVRSRTIPHGTMNLCNTSRNENEQTISSLLHGLTVRLRAGDVLMNDKFGYIMEYSIIEDPEYLIKSGALIETRFADCDSQPCQHNASCVSAAEGLSMCRCTGRYIGMLCQSTWCDTNPCNNGTCTLTPSYYTCDCGTGRWGSTCNMTSVQCDQSVCGDNGKCVRTSEHDTECVCAEPYTGPTCSEKDPGKESVAEKLLDEPIWIGMIAVLSVLALYCVFYCVRVRCEERFRCCMTTHKKIEDYDHKKCPSVFISPLNRASNLYEDKNPVPISSIEIRPQIVIDEVEDPEPTSPSINAENSEAAAKVFDSFKGQHLIAPQRQSIFSRESPNPSRGDNPTFVLCSEDINSASDDDKRGPYLDPTSSMRRSFSTSSSGRFPQNRNRYSHTNSLDGRLDTRVSNSDTDPSRLLSLPGNRRFSERLDVEALPTMATMERTHHTIPENSQTIVVDICPQPKETSAGDGEKVTKNVSTPDETNVSSSSMSPSKACDRRKVFAMKARSFNTLLAEDIAAVNREKKSRNPRFSSSEIEAPSVSDFSASYASSGVSVNHPQFESGYGSQCLDRLKFLTERYSASVDIHKRGRASSTNNLNKEMVGEWGSTESKDSKESHKKVHRRKKLKRHKSFDFYHSSSNSDEHTRKIPSTRRAPVNQSTMNLNEWVMSNGRSVADVHVEKAGGSTDGENAFRSQRYQDTQYHPRYWDNSNKTTSGSGDNNSISSGGVDTKPTEQKEKGETSKGDTDSAFSSTTSKSIQTSPLKYFLISDFPNLVVDAEGTLPTIPITGFTLDQPPSNTPVINQSQIAKQATRDSAYQTKEPSTEAATVFDSSTRSSPIILQYDIARLRKRQMKKFASRDTAYLLQRVSSKLKQIESENQTKQRDSPHCIDMSAASSDDSNRLASRRRSAWAQSMTLVSGMEGVAEEAGSYASMVRRQLTLDDDNTVLYLDDANAVEMKEFVA